MLVMHNTNYQYISVMDQQLIYKFKTKVGKGPKGIIIFVQYGIWVINTIPDHQQFNEKFSRLVGDILSA